jgi:hypothetical protein
MAKSKTRARLLSLLLAAALIMCAATPALADAPHWAQGAVDELNAVYTGENLFTASDAPVTETSAKAIFTKLATRDAGDNGQSTSPEWIATIFNSQDQDATANRGQVCNAVWAMCNTFLALPQGTELSSFTDINNEDIAIRSLATLGVVNGVGYGYFLPNDTVTSAQLAVIIQRTYNKLGGVTIANDLIQGRAFVGDNIDFTEFSDVPPGHWAYDGVMFLFVKRIVIGMGKGEDGKGIFAPAEIINRYQLAAVMMRVAEVEGKKGDESYKSIPLPADVPSDGWFVEGVKFVLHHGYMATDANGNFNGDAEITREEVTLAAAEMYAGNDLNLANPSALDRFTDGGSVSPSCVQSMAFFVSIGMLHGTMEGTLVPTAPMTRAEFGVFLTRVMQGLDTSKMHDYEIEVQEALEVLARPTVVNEGNGNV